MRLELTRRSDYALQAMIVLARASGNTVSSAHIAEQTHIPEHFVTQVMGDLVRAGLIGAVLGRSGGYRLAKAPREISVLAIVEAVEGEIRREHCALRGGPCLKTTPCQIHHVFSGAQEAFIARLSASTLVSLATDEAGAI